MTIQAGDPVRVSGSDEYAGRTCPYCRFPLKAGGELTICGACKAAHHTECWSDNGGCAVMGCSAAPKIGATSNPAIIPVTAMGTWSGPSTHPTGAPTGAFAPSPPNTWSGPAYQRGTDPTGGYPSPPPEPSRSGGRGGGRGLIAAVVLLAVAIAGVAVAVVVSRAGRTTNTPSIKAVAAAAHTVTQTVAAPTSTPKSTPQTSAPARNQEALPKTAPRASAASTTTNSSTGPPTSSSGSGDAASASQQAINQYWGDVGSGDYSDAESLATSSEQGTASIGTFQSEQPHIDVLWSNPGVAASNGDEAVRISFYARDTVGSDQTCRHFVIESEMVPSDGAWLYNGHTPGSTTIDQNADGNPNCPA